eukprot:s829_g13.t1
MWELLRKGGLLVGWGGLFTRGLQEEEFRKSQVLDPSCPSAKELVVPLGRGDQHELVPSMEWWRTHPLVMFEHDCFPAATVDQVEASQGHAVVEVPESVGVPPAPPRGVGGFGSTAFTVVVALVVTGFCGCCKEPADGEGRPTRKQPLESGKGTLAGLEFYMYHLRGGDQLMLVHGEAWWKTLPPVMPEHDYSPVVMVDLIEGSEGTYVVEVREPAGGPFVSPRESGARKSTGLVFGLAVVEKGLCGQLEESPNLKETPEARQLPASGKWTLVARKLAELRALLKGEAASWLVWLGQDEEKMEVPLNGGYEKGTDLSWNIPRPSFPPRGLQWPLGAASLWALLGWMLLGWTSLFQVVATLKQLQVDLSLWTYQHRTVVPGPVLRRLGQVIWQVLAFLEVHLITGSAYLSREMNPKGSGSTPLMKQDRVRGASHRLEEEEARLLGPGSCASVWGRSGWPFHLERTGEPCEGFVKSHGRALPEARRGAVGQRRGGRVLEQAVKVSRTPRVSLRALMLLLAATGLVEGQALNLGAYEVSEGSEGQCPRLGQGVEDGAWSSDLEVMEPGRGYFYDVLLLALFLTMVGCAYKGALAFGWHQGYRFVLRRRAIRAERFERLLEEKGRECEQQATEIAALQRHIGELQGHLANAQPELLAALHREEARSRNLGRQVQLFEDSFYDKNQQLITMERHIRQLEEAIGGYERLRSSGHRVMTRAYNELEHHYNRYHRHGEIFVANRGAVWHWDGTAARLSPPILLGMLIRKAAGNMSGPCEAGKHFVRPRSALEFGTRAEQGGQLVPSAAHWRRLGPTTSCCTRPGVATGASAYSVLQELRGGGEFHAWHINCWGRCYDLSSKPLASFAASQLDYARCQICDEENEGLRASFYAKNAETMLDALLLDSERCLRPLVVSDA